ncbi:protein kinase [bacterium]|nr:protein kinase [bacterium]
MIGQTISHYKIIEKLGEGGMGIVYKAHDTQLDRFVALKFLPHYLNSDPVEKERFYHEARATSALNHPNITTIYEIAEHDGQLYIALEFVEGSTLKQLVKHEIPSNKTILDIAIQACDGISTAHEKSIVHRDIKSDNIMVTPKGQVKVMDFGLAKVKGAVKLTNAGSTVGTAAYMSPEQALAVDVDNRSDIFSFGVVLYELLTAHLPFRGEHQAAITYSLIHEAPQPLARFNQSVSPEMERIVLKALEKDKTERYQHIEDMQADLRKEMKNMEYARTGYVKAVAALPVVNADKNRKVLKYAIPAVVAVIIIAALVFNPFSVQINTQKTQASEKNSLAVMYFQNIADPEDKNHTGDMLADLLITSLSQTKDLEVVSRERLYDIQKEFKADSRIIAPDMATKVAQRAGVTTMLLGSILQHEPTLAVTARIIDVQSGKILSSVRVIGYSSKQIFALVDTLALLIRNDLRIADASPDEKKSVTTVTTNSIEAYRSYIEGVDLNGKFLNEEAYVAFKKAIELDTNFAMAYYALATARGNVSSMERSASLQKAYALSGRLPERERLIIQNTYVSDIENNPAKAAVLMEEYIQKFPHEKGAYLELGTYYGRTGELEKMGLTYLKGIQVDSLDKNLWNILGYHQAGVNNKSKALAAMERYMRLAPAEPNPYDSKGDIYFILGETDSALVWWKTALKFRTDFMSSWKIGSQYLLRDDYAHAEKYLLQYASARGEDHKLYVDAVPPQIAMRQGKMNLAIRQILELLPRHAKQKPPDLIFYDYADLISLYDEIGDFDAAEKYARMNALELQKDPAYPVAGADLLAYVFHRNGKQNLSAELMHGLRNNYDRMAPEDKANVDYTDGVLAFEKGDYDAALKHFQNATARAFPNHAPQYHMALSLLKSGRTGDAIKEFHLLTRRSPMGNMFFDLDYLPFWNYGSVFSVKAHYWLGVAYEKQGEKQKAVAKYETFLRIWKDADFKSNEIDDAKLRLAKLKGVTAP